MNEYGITNISTEGMVAGVCDVCISKGVSVHEPEEGEETLMPRATRRAQT